jgi:hypothetical protein
MIASDQQGTIGCKRIRREVAARFGLYPIREHIPKENQLVETEQAGIGQCTLEWNLRAMHIADDGYSHRRFKHEVTGQPTGVIRPRWNSNPHAKDKKAGRFTSTCLYRCYITNIERISVSAWRRFEMVKRSGTGFVEHWHESEVPQLIIWRSTETVHEIDH